MKKHITSVSSVLLLVVLLSAAGKTSADDHAPYPMMAPVDEYLMPDRDAEIALARRAAPETISHDATILVLTRHGYETAVAGKNGFVCVVERAWMSPFDSKEFWNPKLRGPICFNPPAVRSILPATYKRTEMALAGRSRDQIMEGERAAFERKELPALEPGAMSYMMAKGSYLTDKGDHNLAHLMFYTPAIDPATWGADHPDTPVMFNPQFKGTEPVNVFVVPVGRWSDGTAAPVM
jgi:hypothetical protein